MSVFDPVTEHLKDLDHWVGRAIEPMADAVVGAERLPVGILSLCPFVRNVPPPDGSLRSAEITEETISVGGWQTVQEPADCGEYREEKKGRNASLVRSNRRDASSAIVFSEPGW